MEPFTQAASRRATDFRALAQSLSAAPTVKSCGQTFKKVDLLRDSSGRISARAVMRCKRRWECACCSQREQLRRRATLTEEVSDWLGTGRSVAFVTVAPPHVQGEPLALALARAKRSRERLLSGRARGALLAPHRVVGVDWTLEVGLGQNSWHPHFHMLFFIDGHADASQMAALETDVRAAWVKAVRSAAGRRVRVARDAVDVRLVDDATGMARYLTKLPGESRDSGGFALLGRLDAHRRAEQCSRDNTCDKCRRIVGQWSEYVAATYNLHRYHAANPSAASVAERAKEPVPKRRKAQVVARLDQAAWSLVLEHRAYNRTLLAADSEGVGGVRNVLLDLLSNDGCPRWQAEQLVGRWVTSGSWRYELLAAFARGIEERRRRRAKRMARRQGDACVARMMTPGR